mgnify:FL=1
MLITCSRFGLDTLVRDLPFVLLQNLIKLKSLFVNASTEGSLAAVPTGLKVVGDEPLLVVAAVVGDLVRGHVLAVGGALVSPTVAPHVGQAAHRD